MSFEHKAFIFDSSKFDQELKKLLESALHSKNINEIKSFILSNKLLITDPYEGEPLEDNWEDLIEDKDVDQYGDFALTKFYSPILDRGLGDEWEKLQKIIADTCEQNFSPLLGIPIGIEGDFFDPGKMGSYFQSNSEVVESLNIMGKSEVNIPDDLQDSFRAFKELLEQAKNENKGIYVTF